MDAMLPLFCALGLGRGLTGGAEVVENRVGANACIERLDRGGHLDLLAV